MRSARCEPVTRDRACWVGEWQRCSAWRPPLDPLNPQCIAWLTRAQPAGAWRRCCQVRASSATHVSPVASTNALLARYRSQPHDNVPVNAKCLAAHAIVCVSAGARAPQLHRKSPKGERQPAKKERGVPGIEPETSSTQTKNHTTRPNPLTTHQLLSKSTFVPMGLICVQ